VETPPEVVPALPPNPNALDEAALLGTLLPGFRWPVTAHGPLFHGDPTPTGTMPITTLVLRARKATNGFEPETED
jgi:hypothetical protein